MFGIQTSGQTAIPQICYSFKIFLEVFVIATSGRKLKLQIRLLTAAWLGRKRGWLGLLDSNSHWAFNSSIKFSHVFSTSQPNSGGTWSQTQGNQQEYFILISHRIPGHATAFWARNLPALAAPEETALAGSVDPTTHRVSSAVHGICHGANPDPAGCTWKHTQKLLCMLVQLVWKRSERENIGVFVVPSQVISPFYSYLNREKRGKTKPKWS